MSIDAGTQFGRYEIRSKLGEGGMGEVYLAEDTQLGRHVAIKLLPPETISDEHARKRLVREARAAATLDHPNICSVYEVGEADGRSFIAMQYLEGETLDARIKRQPLELKESLHIASQVADALAEAHTHGIIHRDIKPSNIIITARGQAKVMDFGLARVIAGAVESEAETQSLLTTPGTILGTVPYMSPEQVRGEPVDARTDIFSFGVVLYEMLSGRQPFASESAAATASAILTHEPPPLARFTRVAPAELERVVVKALTKDREERYQTAKDLLLDLRTLKHQLEFQEELERTETGTRKQRRTASQPGPPLSSKSAPLLQRIDLKWWLPLAVIVVGLVLAVWLLRRKDNQSAVPIALPKLSQLTFAEGIEQYPAWSADGKQLAYSGEVAGVRKIFLKRLETGEETHLTHGINDDIQPAWSPDNQQILFVRSRQANEKLEPGDVFGAFEGGDIWIVNVHTGKEAKLIDNAFNPAFSPEGKTIAFDAAWVGPHRIWIADNQGHNSQQLTSDTSEEVRHVRPRWSPDGTRIVFQNLERTKFNVRVVDVAQRKLAWVTNDLFNNLNPVWSQSGKFIYFSSDRGGGHNVWRIQVSSDGVAANSPQQLTTGAGQDVELAMSADGRRLALSILKQNADVWRLPVSAETGKPTGAPQEVITTTREDSRASWSPDSTMIAFNSDRGGDMNLWLYSLRDGSTRQLTKGPGGDFQPTWSPDGKWLVFFSSRTGNADIWAVELETAVLKQLTSDSSIDINPFYSPDGKYIAYQSDQTGRPEVWVMKTDGAGAHQLTRVGVRGHFLRWNRTGDAVIFRCPFGDKPRTMQASLNGAEPQALPDVTGGSHMSFSPDYSLIMDVLGHKALWVSPLVSGQPQKVFELTDKDVRIDYPVWSPDGKWVLFDRFRPQGGDIWMIENFESTGS